MELVGIVVLAPLTKRAEDRVRGFKINDTHDTNVKRDVSTDWNVQAAYIAGIAARSYRARGYVVGATEAWLSGHNIRTVIARPISDDGLRAVRRWGFVPVGQRSRFWILDRAVTHP